MSKQYDLSHLGNSVGFLLFLAVISGCALSNHPATEAQQPRPYYILYSPNGEPLNGGQMGRPTCEEAQSNWFRRVDTNYNGRISHSEFIADATAQFARMDLDRNGYLLPEELERYRLPFRQDATSSPIGLPFAYTDSYGEQHGRHRGVYGDSARSEGSNGYSQIVEIDPVMSADTNNTFKVTLQEFIEQADKTFNKIDVAHEGYFSLNELLKYCVHKKDTG